MANLWPHEHDGIVPLAEEYGHISSVSRSDNGIEQRMSLNRHPVGAAEYLFTLESDVERDTLQALLYATTRREWIVPLWQYASPLTAPVTAGDDTIPVETVNMPLFDELNLGRWAVVYERGVACEALEIQLDNGNSILVYGSASNSYSTMAYAMPARRGVVQSIGKLEWLTSKVLRGTVRFDFQNIEDAESIHEFVMFGGGVVVPAGGG